MMTHSEEPALPEPAIVLAPAPILEQVLEDCDPSSPETYETARQLLRVLQTTPHAAAVAANQIGSDIRMLAMRFRKELIVLANPVIVKRSAGTKPGTEGCLSFPELVFPRVQRHNKVIVRASAENGEHAHVVFYGWDARVVQHEIDHLDGITVDTLSNGVPR